MNKIWVNGGRPLLGDVKIGGSKNAALPLLFAGILTRDICIFTNLPRVSDVLMTLEILRYLGARIVFMENGDLQVDYRKMYDLTPPAMLTGTIRGSVYLLGSMLGRFGRVGFIRAGGCDFGVRPIDQHLMGFCLLGAKEETEEASGALILDAKSGLRPAQIHLAMPSVGATANLMMAATAAPGETLICNAAAEPHVAALAAFLTAAGAQITGIGTDCVRIRGGTPLHGCRVRVIPDMIEAGTYLCAGLACGGRVRVTEVEPSHLGAVLSAFSEMGAKITVGEHEIELESPSVYRCIHLSTGPYPGFPTDLHPQFAALFTLGDRAKGEGSVTETVWQSRFRYATALAKMGANCRVERNRVFVTPTRLHAASVTSPDLRGGAALLLAALATKGRSEILGASTLGRGYEHLVEKLSVLGADIRVVN